MAKTVGIGLPQFCAGADGGIGRRYILTSNRESGFGRHDVMLEPRRVEDDGIILEFKARDTDKEKELADTVKEALAQIDRQKYETILAAKGVPKGKYANIRSLSEGKRS